MPSSESVTILLVCGSLRRGSANAAALQAAAEAAPIDVRTVIYRDLDALPHFNPDDDREPLPASVAAMRTAIETADAVLISTPEYAGSMPGAFKNMLDWTVGGASLYGRPTAWINPAEMGRGADTYRDLARVLDRAGAEVVDAACADIPIAREAIGADGRIEDVEIRARLRGVVALLVEVARVRRAHAASGS